MMKLKYRKLSLMAHILVSIGWFGAAVAYLALAIIGLTSHEDQTSRAVYISMEMVGWYVIVPFGIATMLAGLVESLGTQWGLFRHWWVLVKFLLTTSAVVILVLHMPTVSLVSGMAREATFSVTDSLGLRTQLLVHAGGGILVLLAATALSVYKPWGLTPYGVRKRNGARRDTETGSSASADGDVISVGVPLTQSPRWARVAGFHAIGLALLFLVVHLVQGGGSH